LAPGGELFHQIVRLTYFSEDLSRHVITQVAKALEYLHEEKGVVHRYVLCSESSRASLLMTSLQRYQAGEPLIQSYSFRSNEEPEAKGAR
jgi:hypothetical protein